MPTNRLAKNLKSCSPTLNIVLDKYKSKQCKERCEIWFLSSNCTQNLLRTVYECLIDKAGMRQVSVASCWHMICLFVMLWCLKLGTLPDVIIHDYNNNIYDNVRQKSADSTYSENFDSVINMWHDILHGGQSRHKFPKLRYRSKLAVGVNFGKNELLMW